MKKNNNSNQKKSVKLNIPSILQNFCQTNLKTHGAIKRIYSYSTGVWGIY